MKIETKTNKDAYLKQNMKEETLKKTSNTTTNILFCL